MLYCEHCENEIKSDDDFCPKCGVLYTEHNCEKHSEIDAEGVCLVCGKICCSECGQFVGQSFLCDSHSKIEVYQSMGRVYGSSDSVEIDYIYTMLEKNDFHPLKFNRKNNSISLGGSDFTLFRTSGGHNGHIINELKLLVPLNELLEAKNLVDELLENSSAT